MRSVFLGLLSAVCLFASGELSNRRAPGFALPDADYKHFYDPQDYHGKVLLIDIMTTSCPHCLLLSTTLEKVKAKYGDKVMIISVVVPPDNPATVAKFVSVNKITNPIVFDMGQMTISYVQAKPGQGHMDVPHLFVIDKSGWIRNDFEYSSGNTSVFEGPGLFTEIDKLLK
ncbi:MAG: TlpA family protein disulfide reductase [Acidobacteriota bacterium]|nr:TlpA family protein disulfide reductase [Acidobacteriota bacterium]